MKIFVTGTDTNVGKTLVSSWLCLQSNYHYFKPIQTGSIEGTDAQFVSTIIDKQKIYPEIYVYKEPVAPYLAAGQAGETIDFNKIQLPMHNQLIIEGAGGLMVPLNEQQLILDLIKFLKTPVILVGRTTLGTINHTLLSIELLKSHKVNLLGIILSGEPDMANKEAIEYYGKTKVLAEIPLLKVINKQALLKVQLPLPLAQLLKEQS